MEIKTLKELKEHIGETVFICSLSKYKLDKPEVIRGGILYRTDTAFRVVTDTPSLLAHNKEIVLYQLEPYYYGIPSRWIKKGYYDSAYYDKYKIFTSEKELDLYIRDYMEKHIKFFVQEPKRCLLDAKKLVKKYTTQMNERITFAEENGLKLPPIYKKC